MARTASIAVAGYFPTPDPAVPQIAKLIQLDPWKDESVSHSSAPFSFFDPCAGDGAAVLGIMQQLFTKDQLVKGCASLFACEMESSRFEGLEKAKSASPLSYSACKLAKGDAFRLVIDLKGHYEERVGASVLFLNPPYDIDPVHGRLEERFLSRFAPTVMSGGALVFLVPFYALKASATTLATHFKDLHCFRFPDGEFEVFKQVVLVGTRRTLLTPDQAVIAQVEAWSQDVSSMPPLDSVTAPVVTVPARKAGFASFEVAEIDLVGLLKKARPWFSTDRGGRHAPIPGIIPDGQAIEMLTRNYPVAMPPRPAHIAAGIAAGIFNGAMIGPDNELSGLPPILVKGVFDREFKVVDERQNKDGEVTAQIQIQQPKLVVTALDLNEKRYHTIRSSSDLTGAKTVEKMTTADLLTSYGRGLMRVMLDHCPVLHDPTRDEDRIELPALPRKLFRAQGDAVMASVKLLGGAKASKAQRRGKAVFVLGEIGSGKSTVALATAQTIGSKRMLIMCPPHLLDSWKDQAAAVLPWAKVMVLASVDDVDAFASDDHDGIVVAIMSREAAKLGHAWESVGPHCPKCGRNVPPGDLAKTRARCDSRRLIRKNAEAKLAHRLGLMLLPCAASDPAVKQLFRGRHMQRVIERFGRREIEERDVAWEAVRPKMKSFAEQLFATNTSQAAFDVIESLLHAVGDDEVTSEVLVAMYKITLGDPSSSGEGAMLRGRIRELLLLLTPGSEVLGRTLATLRGFGLTDQRYAFDTSVWVSTERMLTEFESSGSTYVNREARFKDGETTIRGAAKGSRAAAVAALTLLTNAPLGKFTESDPCGEPLYQAIPTPRRYPLATYLAKRAPNSVDLLVLDEGHEYAGDGSAQGFAAHRLTGLGWPTMVMTGSVMNGYAESLFANQWALDPDFREEFRRDQRQEFVRRYGYLKQLVEQKDKDGKAVIFGSTTDRIETTKTIGSAPGVLPLFVLKFLLRRAVTLHKSDLALDLPKRHDIVEKIQPSPEQLQALNKLQTALVTQIRKDQFSSRAGKLWGQMAELPSFLDRATLDVGNGHGDEFVVAYPESEGGEVVAKVPLFPASTLLPKEEWMLAKIKSELAESRRVMIFTWHTALMPRLARLIEQHLGEKCPVLDANKVAASKRQAWIDKEVIGKKRRVLLVNPVAVQTGLNNLVWFSTELWMENPACNAIVFRQATGRIDRIGATLETRIIFPVYEGTTQEALHKLLLHKVGVSMSTDGLDAESALQAAGVGEAHAMTAMAVGRQLYDMLNAA